MKKRALRLFCAVCASLIVASNLILAVAAAEIFNYDKFVNDPRYEVRAETRNNATWTNWGNSDKEVWTDSGERLLLYYLFNARDAKEKAGYRLFDQVVHLRYKLPSQFTSLYTQNRTYRYYIADLRNGNNDVKDNIIDINGDGFKYM